MGKKRGNNEGTIVNGRMADGRQLSLLDVTQNGKAERASFMPRPVRKQRTS